MLLPAGAVVIFAVAAAVFTTTCSSDGDGGSDNAVVSSPASSRSALGATATPAGNSAAGAAGAFLSALAGGRYDNMWGMLADAPRRSWGGSETLTAFLERKFGGRTLELGAEEPGAPAAWRDPDTGASYEEAVLVPYTLRADGKDQAGFSLAPVAAVEEEGVWRVAGLGPASRRAPIFTPAAPAQGALSVPILVYHHIAPEWPDDFEQRTITVTAAAFEEELAHMRDAGYASMTLAELANGMFYGLPLPEKPVVLTFDDGYEDNFLYAFLLLQQYGFSGSFAVITGAVGSQVYMTWDEARQMQDAGMEFVSHTANHVNLGAALPEDALKEVRESKAALEQHLGRSMQSMIYPYGEPFARGRLSASRQ